MRLFKMIDRKMMKKWPRYKLYRICKAIGSDLVPWQKHFALGGDYVPGYEFDCNKAEAVMVRLLMQNPGENFNAEKILRVYPGYAEGVWDVGSHYRRLKNRCLAAGIPVIQMELYRMVQRYRG